MDAEWPFARRAEGFSCDMSNADQLAIVLRLLLAAVLGTAIGVEREVRGHPAGARTMALVCLGAALFSDISRIAGGDDRIAAQIVTGIGFIGAGMIFREGVTVRGMTTAATIWAVAAIGMAIGFELYVVAVVGSAIAIILLELGLVTKRLDKYIMASMPENARRRRQREG